jgi:hypothetical protein
MSDDPGSTSPAEAQPSDDIPVNDAKRVVGVSRRTVFRLVEAGHLSTRKGADGRTYVSASELRAAARDPGQGRANGTVAQARGTSSPPPSARDGQTDAAVFKAFDAGRTPVEVVQDLELPSSQVAALWKRWREMRDAANQPSVSDRLATLERRLDESHQEVQDTSGAMIEAQERLMRLESAIGEWRDWARGIERRLAEYEQFLLYAVRR